ncbi:hypothetical protein HanXRQr2_Chr12g0522911 [Helianthus annuus]|uniref:Mlo-related protein n=2 Tax=Helianthus annuus TaxID=4232 RepID=A0A9K3EPA8_HELAN|nr:MLO-like protein 5 isoform X2 [Helianthus annuus]KAF5776316.1 hypothetical protein HanXRQr2_Chr12g0522911 [Helianthus annuus]
MANMFGSHQNIAQNRAHNKNKSFTSALSSQTSSQSRSKSGFRIEGGDYSSETKLHQTPTWAVAGVCAIIIIISIALEKVLHKLGKIILAIGTKLQAILTIMAIEIKERHAVVQGIPLVKTSDKYFWFSRPSLMLHLIHFALFQYEYGISSCFHDTMELVIIKLLIGVGTLILCTYITLPLYALLSQMGSNMKKSIFDEQTARALQNWRMAVKRKHEGKGGNSPNRSVGNSPTASPVHSPFHPTTAATLHRSKTTGQPTRFAAHDDTKVLNILSGYILIFRFLLRLIYFINWFIVSV